MQQQSTLVFVYNAESGLFNRVIDVAHKRFSPQTYQCQLWAVTHTNFKMRSEWREFVARLGVPVEFLRANQWHRRYGVWRGVPLPAIFRKNGEEVERWIESDEINACHTLPDLQKLVRARLSAS